MNKEVGKYIEKQKSPQKEILKKLRKIILKTIPKINEEMRMGVPCYGYTKKDPCGKYYIVALKDHVNLGFSLKGLTKKEIELFEGNGKTMKHIKIFSLKDIDEKRIVKLLKMVKKR
jgi:hypothetical protein